MDKRTRRAPMIYVIYECDSQKSIPSICIKAMMVNINKAEKEYWAMRKKFMKDNTDWLFMLAEYDPRKINFSIDSNALMEMKVIIDGESVNELKEAA